MSGQELAVPGIPALYHDKDCRLDEKYISSVHSIAETTVHHVVQETVEDLTRAVAEATQWLSEAVRGELLSQVVASADKTLMEEGKAENFHPLTQTSSAVVRSVAKATVEAVTNEALEDIVQAVEKATEWLCQAAENELISQAVAPDECVAIDTDVDDNPPVIPEAVDVPHFSLRSREISVSHLHELAKATAEDVVRRALEDVTKAIGDTSQSLTQVVNTEATEAMPDENSPPLIAEFDPPAPVPALQLPNSTLSTPQQVAGCHDLAVPFVNGIVLTALQQVKPDNPLESEEYANEEYEEYTPINSPTSEAVTSPSPIPSTRPSEQPEIPAPLAETQPEIPVNVVSGRATPPEPMATPR
ncbi:hypothetical protein DVH05_019124 [Phytophthora capsici]|nr:hypothetical protein DVH05_019124 [Phytophthora capsici]